MMTAREVADVFERIAPLDSGVPNDQLGFIWGDPDIAVNKIGCMWCAHTGSIQTAADTGINLIICHEALWLSGQSSPWYDGPDEAHIQCNIKRRELLDRHEMVVYRSHSNWDALPEFGISDSAVASLGIEGLRTVGKQKFFSVQELSVAMTIGELQTHVSSALGFDACRVYGNRDKKIRRFAFLIGGFGENQLHMPQAAYEIGAEAIIIGEMSEFIVIACLEMGLPVIESLHSMSEIPGIRNQVEVLSEKLPDIEVTYIPSGAMSLSAC